MVRNMLCKPPAWSVSTSWRRRESDNQCSRGQSLRHIILSAINSSITDELTRLEPSTVTPIHTVPLWRIVLCVFSSGFCALAYQMTWLREFRVIFGASTAATAAVLAIFMGGVGAGSIVLGKEVDRLRNPFRFYGQLEMFLALAAALTPLLLWLARLAYVALGGTPALGMMGGTCVRLLLAGVVLLTPTFLMGGTLPAVVKAAQIAEDARRQKAALLYGANTLGAVTGAMFSTFFLFEHLGNRLTLWSAAVLNLIVALAAIQWARGAESEIPLQPAQESRQEPSPPRGQGRFVLGAAAGAGFVFFLMELVWYRMLGPLLGGSTFTFGLILAVALLGIGLGSLFYSLWGGRTPVSLQTFAVICALEALFIALPYALGDRLALLTAVLQPLGSLSFTARVAQWSVVSFIVVFPASVLAGIQFPILIALMGHGHQSIGSHVGRAYGWNTAGAIAGSLAGGFGLLPLLSAPGAWRLSAGLLVALALTSLYLGSRRSRRFFPALPILTASALALLALTATGPTAAWRHSPIGAGRVDLKQATANDQRRFLQSQRMALVWEAEGVESSLGLMGDNGYAFYVNGKSDGSARDDAPMQVLSGLLGAMIHPDPRRSLVIGLGTGSTAGWLADVRSMERVDVLELEPAIQRVAQACAPVNRNALRNPKVHLWFGDAREAMLVSAQKYDLISSEPSNPYRAGVASLFTREFYQAAANRLRAGGLFVQWVQAYEVDGAAVSTVYATLASVFPAVETWQAESSDLLFIASAKPIVYDTARMRQRLQEEPFSQAVAWIWRMTDLEGVFARFIANHNMAVAVSMNGTPVCTDDRNLLEFAFARTVGRETGFGVDSLCATAHERGFHHPNLSGEDLAWEKLPDRQASAKLVDEEKQFRVISHDPAFQARCEAKLALARGNPVEAMNFWSRQSQPPADLAELLLVAHGLAERGDQRAREYAQQLRVWLPAEADGVLAHYHWRSENVQEGFDAGLKSLSAFHSDPWPTKQAMESTLRLALVNAKRPGQQEQALRLFQMLETPFAVKLLEDKRMMARLELASHLDQSTGTRRIHDLLGNLGPNIPWTRPFLELRAAAFSQADGQRAVVARQELAEFEANEPQPFVLNVPSETSVALDSLKPSRHSWLQSIQAREPTSKR